MAVCELTGKKPILKNLVSHSNIKTKTKVQPNIQAKKLYSPALKGFVSLNVAVSTIRSIEHVGGFDTFILRQDPAVLSPRALKILRRIKAKSKPKAGKSRE
jgi:large subunit ribosomal protein L28